jgi:hypothetical protein
MLKIFACRGRPVLAMIQPLPTPSAEPYYNLPQQKTHLPSDPKLYGEAKRRMGAFRLCTQNARAKGCDS